MRAWPDLSPDEQLALRLDYQKVLDAEPRTCSMDEKVARFAGWLASQDIRFTTDDISRKTR